MGRTFARIILCSTDDFLSHKNDKIKGWVEHNGGTFSKEMHPKVTHLLASKQAWKRYIPIGMPLHGYLLTANDETVREARRLRTVKIVRFAWLEDSLLTKNRRPLETDRYDWSQRSIAKKLQAKKAMGGQGDNMVESRSRADGGETADSKMSKDEAIERAGWDEYDVCIARLILDRRRVR